MSNLSQLSASESTISEYEPLRAAAYDFYIYVIPLLEVARTRDYRGKHLAFNQFTHDRAPVDHTSRLFTTPNDDTLYSYAFIDLRQGPVNITVPRTGERYFSLALMDMYSNNFAYAGTRATGGEAVELTLMAPGSEEKSGDVIVAPTPWVWALGRTLADDEADLPAAHAVQDGLLMRGPAGSAPAALAPASDADALETLRAARALMAENPPPADDAPALERFDAAGLYPDTIQESPERLEALEKGFAEASAFLSMPPKLSEPEPQWIYPKPHLGNFGTHYRYRAVIAMAGLFALEPAEAMYMRYREGTDSEPLDGRGTWRLHLAKPLPIDSFWSLTLYQPKADGNLYFMDNRQRRYSIGDRTKGLQYNDDGSLDIWMSAEVPGSDRRSNWLPAPEGPFVVILRAYLPQAELLKGLYQLPLIERVE